MKKYLQFIKEDIDKNFLTNQSDGELKKLLSDLLEEQTHLEKEINYVWKILKDRESNKDEKYGESLPKSIFDFNKEQLDWIFENHNSVSQSKHKISMKYFEQLTGVFQSGFNNKTYQHFFNILTNGFIDNQGQFRLNQEAIKSINFLGCNLKKEPFVNRVRFGISYYHNDEGYYDSILYQSEDDVIYQRGGVTINKGNLSLVIEMVIDKDLSPFN
jgi:hypothetical protein